MADKSRGKTLKKPSLTLAERRAAKRERQEESRTIVRKRKR
ncbi:MAG TPA: hypothetical protein VK083_02690 [Nocardia sp.]|nr:hypothetical protein [Nocardia sp.]HLS75684.1 hypothetical protein [Nocardia sp.]